MQNPNKINKKLGGVVVSELERKDFKVFLRSASL
jgi:hypothetical protein